jgi:hypothetical protein
MSRVDLEHARREADSLGRFAEREGKQDLAEFAAMTRALIAELAVGREGQKVADELRAVVLEDLAYWAFGAAKLSPDPHAHGEVNGLLARARALIDRAAGPIPSTRRHDPPATHDQAGSP